MKPIAAVTRVLLPCLLIAGLSACSSAQPTQFYTLVRPAAAASPATSAPLLIEVLPVSVPMQVDVQEFVIRQGAGQLALVESRKWIAPLGEEMRDALSAALTQQLGARDMHRLPRAATEAPVRRIKVDVRRFDSFLGHQAVLEASWSLSGVTSGAAALTCDSRIVEAVQGNGYEALVQAHQRALGVLASRIAAGLALTTAAPACPQ